MIRRVVLGFAAHLGEAVVFGVSGVVLVYEYQRSKAPTWVWRFVQKARNADLMNNLETKLSEGWIYQKNMSEIVEKNQALCVFSSSMSLEQWRKAWLFRVYRGLYYPVIYVGIIRDHYKDPY